MDTEHDKEGAKIDENEDRERGKKMVIGRIKNWRIKNREPKESQKDAEGQKRNEQKIRTDRKDGQRWIRARRRREGVREGLKGEEMGRGRGKKDRSKCLQGTTL